MTNLIIKRFKGYPPLRLFVYNNLMSGRCDNANFLLEGARFLGKATLRGWALYKIYFGNTVSIQACPDAIVCGELYAVTQRCLMWVDQTSSLGTDRVNVHVNYEVPERISLPEGGVVIEKTGGAKGVATAWVHFYARPLPAAHTRIKSISEIEDMEEG